PNRRPSIEKAPGPSKASATALATTAGARILASCKPVDGAGNQEKEIPKKQTPTEIPAYGVISPPNSSAPLAIRTIAKHQVAREELDGLEKYRIPWPVAARLTDARSNKSPKPGRPPGKVEKSLCSRVSCGHAGLTRKPYARVHRVVTRDRGIFSYLFRGITVPCEEPLRVV